MDEYENTHHMSRENMQEDDPCTEEVTHGIFSSSGCEPKKKEAAKDDKKKKSGCGCKSGGSKKISKYGKMKQSIVHYNPFIVFYLKTYYQNPRKRVTEVACQAAKIWCRMSDKEKAMYIKIARDESARRQKMCKKVKRRKKC